MVSKQRWMDRVAAATVRIVGKDGQGVLIDGGFIVTSAHCVGWNGDGRMALGDHFIETVETKSGCRFRASVIAAEPAADIAVLGEAQPDELLEDCLTFDKWRNTINPVRIATYLLRDAQSRHVYILNHCGRWINGRVTKYGGNQNGCIWVEADEQIVGGASGGPVVDVWGRLYGVVSHFSDAPKGQKCDGVIPIASLALPAWVVLRATHRTPVPDARAIAVKARG